MIEEVSYICDETMSKLLDIYQMFDWKMSWQDFLEQFRKEINKTIDEWKKKEI